MRVENSLKKKSEIQNGRTGSIMKSKTRFFVNTFILTMCKCDKNFVPIRSIEEKFFFLNFLLQVLNLNVERVINVLMNVFRTSVRYISEKNYRSHLN